MQPLQIWHLKWKARLHREVDRKVAVMYARACTWQAIKTSQRIYKKVKNNFTLFILTLKLQTSCEKIKSKWGKMCPFARRISQSARVSEVLLFWNISNTSNISFMFTKRTWVIPVVDIVFLEIYFQLLAPEPLLRNRNGIHQRTDCNFKISGSPFYQVSASRWI